MVGKELVTCLAAKKATGRTMTVAFAGGSLYDEKLQRGQKQGMRRLAEVCRTEKKSKVRVACWLSSLLKSFGTCQCIKEIQSNRKEKVLSQKRPDPMLCNTRSLFVNCRVHIHLNYAVFMRPEVRSSSKSRCLFKYGIILCTSATDLIYLCLFKTEKACFVLVCNGHVAVPKYNVCGFVHVSFKNFYLMCKDHSLPGKNEMIRRKSQDQIHENSDSMDVKGATYTIEFNG